MTSPDQVTFTLRARSAGDDLRPGTLIASPKGQVVYRVLEVWRVRRAGDHRYALRLVCRRLSRSEMPEGAEVLPWPSDPRAPRTGRTTGHRQRQSIDPVPPEAIRQDRLQQRAEQLARARRVGRDTGLVKSSDYGPGIRLQPARAHDGTMLRDADVTVGDAPDPDMPKRTIRRARRTDHLLVLLREGTIDQRQADAGEMLRNAMERSQRSMPVTPRSEGHVAPWDRTAISEQQLKAGCHVRRALAALGGVARSAVLCIVRDGGTIRDYAAFAHVGHTTAAELLRRGLGALADYYKLARPRVA
jgi:hypothetical protein